MKPTADQIIADNIRLLMLDRKIKFSDFQDRCAGVSGRYVRQVVNLESSITAGKMEIIAKFLGVKPWQLMAPGIEIKALTDGRLDALIADFMAADAQGRDLIAMIAARENKPKV